jgi:polygalacturonase
MKTPARSTAADEAMNHTRDRAFVAPSLALHAKRPRTRLAAMLLALCGLVLPVQAAMAQTAPGLIAYTTVPSAVASGAYTVKVNGTPVFVEKIGEVSQARFAFAGRADIEITAGMTVLNPVVSPRSFGIVPTVSDRTLRFSLEQPRKLILRIDGSEKLLLFADAPERSPRRPDQPGVVNLASYLSAGRDPAMAVTAEFQRAIDETAARNAGGGGVLYVPAGLYMSTQLRLKSNVELYLDSGARVRAVPVFNSTNYPIQNGADSAFIYISDASNVKITGRGVIDGNGWNLRTNTPGGGNCKLLRTRNARGVILEDVYFRDSARWSLHFLYSDDVVARNVKLVNDLRIVSGGTLPFVSNTDGFDVDASTFVTVEESFIYTTDDAITPKVTGYMGVKKPAHDLFFRNNVIWTEKAALKIGNEVLHDIYNVEFDDNDIVQADRFIALWNDGGTTIRNVKARHNRTETIGVRDNKNFFYFYIRTQAGFIRDIEVNGLQALKRAPNESRLEGWNATHHVSNFAVRNMYVAGVAMNKAADIPLVHRNAFVSNVTVTPPGADGLPLVTIAADDEQGIEGVDPGGFTLSRAGSLDSTLTTSYSVGGTASAGSDYAALSGSVTFAPGAQQVRVPVTALADAGAEAEETVMVSLPGNAIYRAGPATSAVVAITDRAGAAPPAAQPTVSVVVEDGSSSETRAPLNPGRFRVARTGSTSSPLTVKLAWSGTATHGVDYSAAPAQVTIPAGSDRVQIIVQPTWDATVEQNEKVILNAVAGTGYALGSASGTVTILNVNP